MRVKGPASASCRPGPDAFATNRAMPLPFLPTLFTALVIAVLSLTCRQPAESVPSEPALAALASAALPGPVAQPGTDGFLRAGDADPAGAIPATIAFGQLYPLTPDAGPSAQPARPASTRLANAGKRGCAAGRCEAKRGESVRSAAAPARPEALPAMPVASREALEPEGDALPSGALPFAPTASAVVDSLRTLSADAAMLGGSVVGSLALMR